MEDMLTAGLGKVSRDAGGVALKSATIIRFPPNGRKRVRSPHKTAVQASPEDMRALMLKVAADRDRAAYIRVYEYFSPRVKSFLLGKNITAASADEILQEAMLAVWQKAHLYHPEKAAVSTWIFTIARNKYIDRIRQEKFPELDSEDASLQPSRAASVDDECLAEQRGVAIRDALSRLPRDQREVIYMSFMQGISHGEIGAQLGLPLGTVKSRIRLGFQRLRRDIGEVQLT